MIPLLMSILSYTTPATQPKAPEPPPIYLGMWAGRNVNDISEGVDNQLGLMVIGEPVKDVLLWASADWTQAGSISDESTAGVIGGCSRPAMVPLPAHEIPAHTTVRVGIVFRLNPGK